MNAEEVEQLLAEFCVEVKWHFDGSMQRVENEISQLSANIAKFCDKLDLAFDVLDAEVDACFEETGAIILAPPTV